MIAGVVVWAAAWCTTADTSAARAVATSAWILCAVLLLMLFGSGIGSRATRTWLGAILACAAVAACATVTATAAEDRELLSELSLSGGRVVSVEASVVGKIEPTGSGAQRGIRFDAVTQSISDGEYTVTRSLSILVFASNPNPPRELDIGSRVKLRVTVFPPEPSDRAVLIARVRGDPEILEAPSGIWALSSDLRSNLISATDGLPQPGAGLVAGLAVGDTSAVEPSLDKSMKASSLSHLTAVSGANCALVVGAGFGLGALCGWRRSTRALVAVTALAGFVVLVSPEPSVVRAAAMGLIAMLGVALGRASAGINVLSSAIVVILVIDPWLSHSLGFALSSAATAALLILAGPLARGLTRWMPRSLAVVIAIPLAAQLACGPILVLIDPTVPLYGVVANLLAAPAAPVATVIGLLACLSAPLPVLQLGLTAIAWVPAAWVAGVAQVTTEIPGNAVVWLPGVVGAILLTLVSAALVVVVLRSTSQRPVAKIAFVLSVAVVAGVGGVTIGSAVISGPAATLTVPGDRDIVACDIGQGDGFIVQSAGFTAVVDTGPDSDALDECLDKFGVGRVDLLVLTHFDVDHAGGAEALVGRVDVVFHSPPESDADAALLARLGGRTISAHAGMTGTSGDARWRVLWPRENSTLELGNDSSVVIEFSGTNMPTSIFLGDLGEQPQQMLLATGTLAEHYDVVKVSHHGSADQSDALYERINASIALISVGIDNTYGHPRDTLLATLERLGTHIARTDTDGIIVVSGGEKLGIWREHPDMRVPIDD
nr:ComEC/Rec2 family competence protein [Microbacterium halimionae]